MTTVAKPATTQLDMAQWFRIGLMATGAAVVSVLIVQFIAIALWPDIVLFKPLDSYPRTVLFTVVPAIGATAIFAWLAAHKPDPVRPFLIISVVFLLISFIPDYLLPVPDKTLLASSVAAFMHVVAGVVIVGMLVTGYRRQIGHV